MKPPLPTTSRANPHAIPARGHRRTMAYRSISPEGHSAFASIEDRAETSGFRPIGRRIRALCTLAGAGVFATVLASQPVYAQPPQRGQSASGSSVESEPAKTTATPPKPEPRATESSNPPSKGPARTSTARPTPRSQPVRRPSAAGASEEREPVRLAMRTTAATAATTATAGAAAPAEPAPTPSGEVPAGRRSGGDRGRADSPGSKTVIQDEFLVEGKLEKPSAYYILRRSSLDYDWARLDAKFSPLVLESVQDPLF